MAEGTKNKNQVLRASKYFAPADFIFKIQSFSSILRWATKEVRSNIFESGGHKWRLCLSLRGSKKKGGGDHISLYLSVADTDKLPSGWEILVNFKLFFFNQIENEYHSIQDDDKKEWRFHCLRTECGYDQLLPLSTFSDPTNGFLVGDSCAFGVEIYDIKLNRATNATYELLDLSKTFESPKENVFCWKIKDYRSYPKATDKIQSPIFTIGGVKWRLDLYPNGDSRAVGKNISFFLVPIDFESLGIPALEVQFKIRIRNQLSGGSIELPAYRKFTSSLGYGFTNFLSLEVLKDPRNRYLIDNTMVAEVEIDCLSKVEKKVTKSRFSIFQRKKLS